MTLTNRFIFKYSWKDILEFILIYSMIILFIIPNEIYLKINIYLLFFFISGLILYSYKKVKFTKIEFVTIIGFLFIPIILSYYNEFYRVNSYMREIIYMYPFFIFRRCKDQFKNKDLKKIKIIYIWSFLSLIIQVLKYRYLDRMVLSVIDPNVSGAIILLFFYLSVKLKNKIGITFSLICCVLFRSRNLMLALAVYFFVKLIKKYFCKLIRKIDLRMIFVLIYTLFIIINIVYLDKHNFENIKISYSENFSRLTGVVDYSNTYRFLFNVEVLKNLGNNLKLILVGGEKLYVPSVVKNILVEVSPHNDLFKQIYYYGLVFTSVKFMYILGTIEKKIKIYENYEIIISYIVFGCFLGGIILVPNVYIFYLCLLIENFNNRRKNEIKCSNTSI